MHIPWALDARRSADNVTICVGRAGQVSAGHHFLFLAQRLGTQTAIPMSGTIIAGYASTYNTVIYVYNGEG